MASYTVSSSSQKFNWADDDGDDFDLDSWNATADTSAPTAAELGPLQVPPTEDETAEEEVYTLERIRNERACWNPPATQEASSVEPTQDPEPVAPLPAESWYLAVLDFYPEHQVISARYDIITRAIGFRYEGKEHSEAPAYPELSCSEDHRSNYASEFRNWKLESRGISSTKVYRNSPLNIVTSIDEAHDIDDVIGSEDEEVEEVLDEYEAMQVAAFEQTEQDAPNRPERDEEADSEMNEAIDRIIYDQITNHIDQFRWFSRRELVDMYHEYKAQQQQTETGDDVSDGEDSGSDDGWDEELFELYIVSAEEAETSLSVIAQIDNDETMFSITCPFDVAAAAAAIEEELDFNDIVFGEDGKNGEDESQTEHDTETSDEGYISSSPPDTPILETFNKAGGRNTQDGVLPVEMRLSASSMRRKTNGRKDSIDALKVFRQTAKHEQRIDDAFEDEIDDAVSENLQGDIDVDDEPSKSLEAVDSSDFILVVTPPEDEKPTQSHPFTHTTLLSTGEATAIDPVKELDQIISIETESHSILSQCSAFPSLSTTKTSLATDETATTDTSTAPSEPSSPRCIDTTQCPSMSPSDPPPHITQHIKNTSVPLAHLTTGVSVSWLYTSQVPWTQIGIVTAGVVAGGLLSMARYR